jgi:hypothetical protein
MSVHVRLGDVLVFVISSRVSTSWPASLPRHGRNKTIRNLAAARKESVPPRRLAGSVDENHGAWMWPQPARLLPYSLIRTSKRSTGPRPQ